MAENKAPVSKERIAHEKKIRELKTIQAFLMQICNKCVKIDVKTGHPYVLWNALIIVEMYFNQLNENAIKLFKKYNITRDFALESIKLYRKQLQASLNYSLQAAARISDSYDDAQKARQVMDTYTKQQILDAFGALYDQHESAKAQSDKEGQA